MADHHPNPNTNTNTKKTSRGKQKIEVKLIDQTSSRQVTFTKRRSGIFKKAGELALLCGAEVAIISFSVAQKPFSFGNPSTDAVINHFLNNNNRSCPNNNSSSSSYLTRLVHEKKKQYEEAVKEFEEEKKKMEGEDGENGGSGFLWEVPIENMSLKELEEYTEALLEMRREVIARVNELMMRETTNLFSSNNHAAFSPFLAANNDPPVVSSMSASAGNHVGYEDQNLENENWGI